MKCHLQPYTQERWNKDFPDAPDLTDDDGMLCPLRKDGVCTAPEDEQEIQFNLSGVMWCVPHSKVTRIVFAGDETND